MRHRRAMLAVGSFLLLAALAGIGLLGWQTYQLNGDYTALQDAYASLADDDRVTVALVTELTSSLGQANRNVQDLTDRFGAERADKLL